MLLAFAAMLVMQDQPPLHLVCSGGGIHRRAARSYGTVRSGGNSADFSANGLVSEGYADEVNIELNGETGRIRVPSGLLPLLRNGGSDGWWPLRNIEYRGDEIRAKFALNFMNQPNVRIDRRTGHISIRGKSGNFSGECDAYDPATAPRRF